MIISIIIPCYNATKYLDKCIYSAFEQTYKEKEIICIDNNSTDDSWEKLQQLKESYPQLIIDRELKPGACAARNKGLSLANGKWIQFLDVDDLILPEKIEHQASFISNHICFIVGSSKYIRNGEVQINLVDENRNVFENLSKVRLGNPSTNLFSKCCLEKISGWDESLQSSQEYDLMFRLLKQNENIFYDKKILTTIYQVPDSITTKVENKIPEH